MTATAARPIAEARSAPAARPTPMTPEELADRVVPEDPRIAPDGSAVAFVAAPAGRKEEHKARAVWLTRPGQPARMLTGGLADDRAPRWSPDGGRLAFLSDRAERGKESGLYVLPMDGGEGQRLGELGGELSDPRWSPDGAGIVVLRTDPKDPAAKKREDERDDRVVADADPRFARLWLVDATTGVWRCLTPGDREVRSFCWKSDGSGLLAITTALPGWDAIFDGSDLWHVPASGGLPRKLASFAMLAGSPTAVDSADGPLALVVVDGGIADPPARVRAVPLAGGEPTVLLPDWDAEVESIQPLPGRPGSVLVKAVERTHGGVYALNLATMERETLLPEDRRGSGSVLGPPSVAANGSVAFVWSDSATPEEVWLADDGGARPLSEFGAVFAGRLQPGEVVRWASDDGLEIEGILIRPANTADSAPVPLVVEIHGGPSWQWEDRAMLDWHDWAQMLASHGIAVLLPNPRGSTAYGAAFQKKLHGDVGGGEAADLISGARAMVERGIANPERLGVGGWSWGGYLTARVIERTSMFKAAVMGAGLSNMVSDHGTGDIPSANLLYYPGQPYDHMDAYWEASPIRYASRIVTPTLIVHGDADARVHPAQGMELYRALKVLNVPVEFVRYPREGHPIEERAHQLDLMQRVLGWYRRWLLP
jgi:dipeptidyl aminopeptidase/acylaminoacyl peptidase